MHNFQLVNGDTDSISIRKPDSKAFTVDERQALLDELNGLTGEHIEWEDDNYYKKFVVVATKNYIMEDEKGKLTVKGSALKATTKEAGLKRFIDEVIDCLVKNKPDHIFLVYLKYAQMMRGITDITDWCSKKTVTKAVLTSDRTQEVRIREAIGSTHVSEGDKVYLFFKTPTELCLREDFNGEYCLTTLRRKLYDTLCIFEEIIDVKMFPNFALKNGPDLLAQYSAKL